MICRVIINREHEIETLTSTYNSDSADPIVIYDGPADIPRLN